MAKLMVLLLAVYILDVSVDVDYTCNGFACVFLERFDDTDSFSEYLIESVLGNNNAIAERPNEDRHPLQKLAHKYAPFIAFSSTAPQQEITGWQQPARRQLQLPRNTHLQQEDHSTVFSPPPEQSLI
ncbi:hypothetical protein [Sediminibacterium soli]|uniref:hypothetical protein n=1 Tax=Sediminibacterium soli TaxID=2698829 RepID=UPI00137B4679|nr:hypothetical protein [Sediminibacterium soli]NCI46759.1 hypothetical protein [Sediminibacterium soli]